MERNPNTELLLEASLDSLHGESREWLETVAFWKDETRFFKDLLENKKKSFGNLSEYGKILEDLNQLHEGLYDYLVDDISEHEIFLGKVLKTEKGIADAEYREKHQKLKSRMNIFERDFRAFKRMVFGYVKAL